VGGGTWEMGDGMGVDFTFNICNRIFFSYAIGFSYFSATFQVPLDCIAGQRAAPRYWSSPGSGWGQEAFGLFLLGLSPRESSADSSTGGSS